MTTTSEARVQFADSEVVSPRVRTSARRALFWVIGLLILVILAVGALLLDGTSQSQDQLSGTNPGPTGAEALIAVLRTDGVTAYTPRTLAAASRDAGKDRNATTLAVYDPNSILSDAQLRRLRTIAPTLILIQPSGHELDILSPGVSQAGIVPSVATSDCSYLPVERAGTVTGLQQGYRLTGDRSSEQGCLGHDSVYSLVLVRGHAQTVSVLGSTTILTNQSILQTGNGALALGLFGSRPHLVWYLPSLADVRATPQDGTIPRPPWVSIAIVLAVLVVLAAAVWRGRRLGPVVVERMPVVVRSNETTEGRARLYQRASARSHALDALRVGSVGRIATLCRLPNLATLDEVVGAAARLTGRSPAALRDLLVEAVPRNDVQLVRLSDELLQLEADVRRGAAGT